jgi:hypothetical protein
LLPEQINPSTGEFLGNFPQAFSHIGVITSGVTSPGPGQADRDDRATGIFGATGDLTARYLLPGSPRRGPGIPWGNDVSETDLHTIHPFSARQSQLKAWSTTRV